MQQDIKPYNEKEFKKLFENSPLCKQLQNDFDELIWNYKCDDFPYGTARQQWGDKNLSKTRFSVLPFYYLEFLTEKNPTNIYDLGCGWNIFKKYLPSIIGVGAEPPDRADFFADIHDYVDDDYIKGHQNYFESVFAICSLHFVPMSDIRKRILDFASMVKPGGRGWISLNAQRMLEKDLKMFVMPHKQLELWIRKELSNLPVTVLQFDMDLSKLDEGMNGNIHLIFEK
jgi:hypothetical protein